jgi:zinc protease
LRGATVVLALVAVACHPRQTPLGHPSVASVYVPRYLSTQMSSGLVVLLNPDSSLPVLSIALAVRGGALTEAAGQAGVTALLATMLTIRTAHRDRLQLATAYDDIGDAVRADVGADGVILQLDVPAEQMEGALTLLAEIVRQPALDEADLARGRTAQVAALAALAREPGRAGLQGLRQVVFGDHRLGLPLPGTRRTVAALAAGDLRARHRQLFWPGNAALVLCGRFVPEQAATVIERAWGDWRGAPLPLPRPAPLGDPGRKGIHLIARPGLSVTMVHAGFAGPSDGDESHELVRVGARLARSRTERRLAAAGVLGRGVQGIDEVSGVASLHGVAFEVAPRLTAAGVRAVVAAFRSSDDSGFGAEVGALLSEDGLPLHRLTRRSHAAAEMFLRGLPVNHWLEVRDRLADTEPDARRAALDRFVRSAELQVVLVGDPEVINAQLAGEVQPLQLALDEAAQRSAGSIQ